MSGFAGTSAWAVTIHTDMNKLERLMGHGSKEMLFKTYGKYTEGLEEDEELILEYFGTDFLRRDKKIRNSESYSESDGDSCFV